MKKNHCESNEIILCINILMFQTYHLGIGQGYGYLVKNRDKLTIKQRQRDTPTRTQTFIQSCTDTQRSRIRNTHTIGKPQKKFLH